MNPARQPQPDADLELPPVAPTPLRPPPSVPPISRRRWITALAAGAIVVAAAIGGAAVKLSSPPKVTGPDPMAVAGFAQDFVHTYLTSSGEGSEENLLPFLGYTPSLDGMESGTFYVTHLAIRDIQPGESEWRILIKANLLEQFDHGYRRSDPLWLSVAVADEGDGELRALSLPSLLRPPAAEPLSPVQVDSLPVDPELVASSSDLVGWYLTGSVPFGPMMPVGGFTEADLMSLQLDEDTAIAGVNATTATGHVLRVDIPLERVEGIWRVAGATRPPN